MRMHMTSPALHIHTYVQCNTTITVIITSVIIEYTRLAGISDALNNRLTILVTVM